MARSILTANINKILRKYFGSSQLSDLLCKKGVLNNLTNFTGKHLCWSHFLTKLQAWRSELYRKEAPTQVLSCDICKILKRPILKNICERLLLILQEELLNSFSRILYFGGCLWNFLISYSGQYTMVLHLHYIWFSWQGKKQFQQLPKLMELKFISTTWPH